MDRADRIAGVILGTAAGDALGLPREGMSRRRGLRIHGAEVNHGLILKRGMISDDTEHTCMTAQALLAAPDDVKSFSRSLAWRFRWWLAGIPAGVGFGTLRAILKLWVGFSPENSGVRSAGNGPAMRSAIIGACFNHETLKMKGYVKSSTLLTHNDPKALEGALAVAIASGIACECERGTIDADRVFYLLKQNLEGTELLEMLDTAKSSLNNGDTPETYADKIGAGKGISGYINQTVAAAIFCWLKFPGDFHKAVSAVILLGGDTDTTGAITGALSGATAGASGIQQDLINGIFEWPRSVTWMRMLAEKLACQFPENGKGEQVGTQSLFWPAIPFRNLFFTSVILGHGIRRLFPPY